jgi:hypothetical protein
VGDAQAWLWSKALHPSWHDAQPWLVSLFAAFKQNLQPKADAQEGLLPLHCRSEGFHKAPRPQLLHGWVESPISRQDDAIKSL